MKQRETQGVIKVSSQTFGHEQTPDAMLNQACKCPGFFSPIEIYCASADIGQKMAGPH